MNYKKIYERLCERGQQHRILEISELHHIIPKCIGGSDELENLTRLTPEEHFLAHLLLVKMYPTEHKLIYAANMMCVTNSHHGRSNNKRYGWLKRKHISVCRQRTGDANASTGSKWVTNTKTRETYKLSKDVQLPLDCIYGRNAFYIDKVCPHCRVGFQIREKSKQTFCSKTCGLTATGRNIKQATEQEIKIEIDGIQYDSLSKASKILSIPIMTIHSRLANANFPSYKRI